MGLLYPADDTWFIAPHERSLVGRISVAGAKDTSPKVEARNVRILKTKGRPEGFAFVGRISRCDGEIEQMAAMISLPGDPVIYVERLRAVADVEVKEVATGLIGVLNEDAEPLTKNQRAVWTAAGKHLMRGASTEPAKLHVWDSPWASIDDRLTLVIGIAVSFEGWQIAVNFGENELVGEVFGTTLALAPLAVSARLAR
jgi:hypothetical protein